MRHAWKLAWAGLVAAGVSGCQQWSLQSQPIPEVLAQHPDSRYRITRLDGGTVVLEGVSLERDSLVGTPPVTTTPAGVEHHAERVVIPADSIALVERRNGNAAGTITLLLPVALAAAAVVGLAASGPIGGTQ